MKLTRKQLKKIILESMILPDEELRRMRDEYDVYMEDPAAAGDSSDTVVVPPSSFVKKRISDFKKCNEETKIYEQLLSQILSMLKELENDAGYLSQNYKVQTMKNIRNKSISLKKLIEERIPRLNCDKNIHWIQNVQLRKHYFYYGDIEYYLPNTLDSKGNRVIVKDVSAGGEN